MLQLKTYQEKVLDTLKNYLFSLSEFKTKYENAMQIDPDIARDYNFPKRAWEKATGRLIYHSKSNGLGEPLPDVYLKVPTGGGKTFLACHAIDHIHKTYLKKQTGLVLWIMPSTQIYRQTISCLKDREHPYRQMLDVSSGGKTLIKEKLDPINKLDVEENLVILMLMLPSAARKTKETLKMFRDASGYTDFFPEEDNFKANEEFLKAFPNLDYFGDDTAVFGRQIKTSMGNTLRVLQPLVIIDEGHRAYSETARDTIQNFNPSFILELSATPPDQSNKLVEITGRELNEEEMIKLDIHLTNKSSLDWKDTMLCSLEQRKYLEKRANEYEQDTGEYIRPINLIQVERTGKDQRGGKFIHAEDVKAFLIKKCSIPESHIAIKSSEKDDIEGIDLFGKECDIRYIITKQALQEGWDCSFAYILTILTNPSSKTGITQLIGRILRQPNARKTKVQALDECYIYTFRQNARDLVKTIKTNLESEGLGDIAGRINVDSGDETNGNVLQERDTRHRDAFKTFEGKIYLPKFVIQETDSWRDINFDIDLLSRIDWTSANLDPLDGISLSKLNKKEQALTIGLSDNQDDLVEETKQRIEKQSVLKIDEAFLTQHILEIVPNPWIGFDIGKETIKRFLKRYDEQIVSSNFVFIIEELKKLLLAERDRLAEIIFKKLVKEKKLCFFLISESGGFKIPKRIKVRSNKQLIRDDNTPIQRSLFDYVPEENINELEKSVAIYLDQQEKLLWWYRNMSKQDYHIQGWKRNKIYPDFVVSDTNKSNEKDFGDVYVLETKGLHLKNEDTKYKQDVFELCNQLGAKKTWKELDLDFNEKKFEFQVVFDNEWETKVNKLFG